MGKKTQKFDARQRMKSKTFEIFHYRDEHFKSVSIHHHDFYEIYFFIGGNVSYLVEGEHYRLNRGDILLISPMELHQPIANEDEPYERIVLWIDRGYLASLCSGKADLSACFFADKENHINLLHSNAMMRGRITELFELLNREAHSGSFASEAYANGLIIQLLVEINRMSHQKKTSPQRRETQSLANQITSYINLHYSEDISLDLLAKKFFVSKYYLSHEFSQSIGIGIYRYLTLKRLTIAKELLTEGLSANEVCSACGFHNYTTFYRIFKSEYGISPGKFAEQAKG